LCEYIMIRRIISDVIALTSIRPEKMVG